MSVHKRVSGKWKKIIPFMIVSILALSALGYEYLGVESVKNKGNNILQTSVDQHLETDNTAPGSVLLSGPNGVIDYNTVIFIWIGKDDTTCKENLLYAYRLKGETDEWSPWIKDTSKTYSDLPNGEYTFQVKAKDEAGNMGIMPAEGEFIVDFEEKKPDDKTYEINWLVMKGEYPTKSPIFVSKHRPYTEIVRIPKDNIKSVSFELTWKDDHTALFSYFGKDILTFSIKAPNGTKLFHETSIGNGKIKYTANDINAKPPSEEIKGKNESDALTKLTKYCSTNWKNESIEIIFDLKLGEKGIIRRLLDKGNDFDLSISYKYYKPELEDTEDNPPDTKILAGASGTVDYNDITFIWIGLDDTTSTGSLKYSYKLFGKDLNWANWVSSTSKTYSNLPNGEYTFEVKSKDNAGNIDEAPATRTFIVEIQIGPNRFATTVVGLNFGEEHHSGYSDPNMALGGPYGKGELMGSLNVLSLGKNGNVTLGFDVTITDKQGMDFIIFENPFHLSAQQDQIYAELMYVEVSTDGTNFARFPSISNTLGPGMVYLDDVTNLAGVNPVYAHIDENDIDPFNPNLAGGDAFDLQSLNSNPLVQSGLVDLQNINYVRLIDILGNGSNLDSRGNPIYDPTDMDNGADLDAVAVINYT